MAGKGNRITVLLRSTADNPNQKGAKKGKKKKTGTTYTITRHVRGEKLKGIKKFDPVTNKHELFDEEKAKN